MGSRLPAAVNVMLATRTLLFQHDDVAQHVEPRVIPSNP